MDAEILAKLIADHARFPNVLTPLFVDQSNEFLRSRPAPAKWSPLEILVHLRDEEVEDFWPRAQAAAAGRPIEKAIDPVGWVTARRYNEADPPTVLADWVAKRQQAVAWLLTVDKNTLDNAIDHPALGTIRCGDFIAAWRTHDLLHLRQLATTLAQLEAQQLAGWRVSYAGAIP